jgi:D-amino peptidase
VLAAIEGLRAQGFTDVRVSDSHRSGRDAPNVDAAALPSGCELRFESSDPYGGALLDGVSAVACIGMHAAGGTTGFAAHTVQAGVEWRLGGQRISETHLAMIPTTTMPDRRSNVLKSGRRNHETN